MPIGIFAENMNPDSENFEQLRRLLKLKRYEQPPPRYFHDFSNQVIARISLGEAREHRAPFMETLLSEASRWQRIWTAFAAKPFAAGGFGLAMSALLITGMVYSERSNAHPMALVQNTESSGFTPEEIAVAMAADHPLRTKRPAHEASSTDPVAAAPLDDRW
jgi:hypothetical protein